jgi:hypothetical protein
MPAGYHDFTTTYIDLFHLFFVGPNTPRSRIWRFAVLYKFHTARFWAASGDQALLIGSD